MEHDGPLGADRWPTHEDEGYDCPFCALMSRGGNGVVDRSDIVAVRDGAFAFISPRWWPRNEGHVLVAPTEHHENLYTIPSGPLHAVTDLIQEVARAIRRSYGCDGVSTRQHNEPAGDQDVWHFHVHVFPRYDGDGLYGSLPAPDFVTAEQRRPYAERLRAELGSEPRLRFRDVKVYETVSALDQLRGPATGVVTLPVELFWSGDPRFDLEHPAERDYLYQSVLAAGTAEEISRYLNRDLLLKIWPRLPLDARLVETWHCAHPGLECLRRGRQVS